MYKIALQGPCKTCRGKRVVVNPALAEWVRARRQWLAEHPGEPFVRLAPREWEERPCPDCKGQGEQAVWMPFEDFVKAVAAILDERKAI